MLAIGMAESVVPSARVDAAIASGASKSAVPALISPSAGAPDGLRKIRPRQPVVETRQANAKMTSTILEKTGSVGAAENAPAIISEEYRRPAPERRDSSPAIIKINISRSIESKDVGSLPAADNLAVTSAPIIRRSGNETGIAAGISIPAINGHQPGLKNIKSADRNRLIYGTSARNADKVYFPQEFGQSLGVLNANAGIKRQLSPTPQIASHRNDDPSQAVADGERKETAGALSPSLSKTTTGGENQEPLQNGGYFEYKSSAEQTAIENVVAKVDEGAMVSTGLVPDESKTHPVHSGDSAFGAASSGQRLENDNAS